MLSQEDLKETMRAKTDAELYLLLRVHSQDYTPEAIKAASEEFSQRQLDEPTTSRIMASAEKALEVRSEKHGGTAGEREVQRISSIGSGLTAFGEGLSVVWKIARFCAFVFVLIALAYGLYSWMEESGWISHREETVISARSDWLAAESKECWSATQDSVIAALSGKEVGYAMSSVSCDDGPEHKMKVTFYGRKVQAEHAFVNWRCTRNEVSFLNDNSFTCYQTGWAQGLKYNPQTERFETSEGGGAGSHEQK